MPTAPRIDSAQSRSASVARVPAAMAAAPAPTRAGVLGMARTTGRGWGRAPSIWARVTPAAMDSTRPTPAGSEAHTAATWAGLTARTTPSASTGWSLTPRPG